MKKILGMIVLVFTVFVFVSCNKPNTENKENPVKEASVKEVQKPQGKSQAIVNMEKDEEIHRAISEKEELIKKNRQEAEIQRKTKSQKEARTQFNLGMKYSSAKGSSKNLQEAVKCFKKSSEQGYAQAQHSLGLMYFKGEGVEMDYAKAYKWASLAADQNKNYKQLADLIETKLTEEELVEVKALISGFIPQE
jgi:TPR repeat protein